MSLVCPRFLLHRRVSPWLAASLAFLAAPSQASEIKTDGLWRGTGGASFSAVSGNSRSTAMGLDTAFVRATAADKWSLDARARYARSVADGVRSTTTNQWVANGQYDLNLGRALYLFGKLGLESDAVVDLDLRQTLAGGLGYKWWQSERHQASVFSGAAYTVDRYGAPQLIDGRTASRFNRSSLLLGQESQHELSSTTTFKQRLEVFTGLSGDKATLTKFTAAMAVAVNARFSVTLGLSHVSNSEPPAGSRRNDTGLLAGISLRFGAD
jgi:putative salt-induced outer membrane protein